MKRTIAVRRALLTALTASGLATVLVLAGCGSDQGHNPGNTGSSNTGSSGAQSAPGSGTSFNDADVSFTQNMIAHHKQAVELADLAATQAANPELKKLASEIKTAQQAEVKTLTDWLTTWGKPLEPTGGHGGHAMAGMLSDDELSKLRAAKGTAFDLQFLRAMIAHHNGAIQMAREEQTNGAHPEVKALAKRSEQSQATDVQALQKILDRV